MESRDMDCVTTERRPGERRDCSMFVGSPQREPNWRARPSPKSGRSPHRHGNGPGFLSSMETVFPFRDTSGLIVYLQMRCCVSLASSVYTVCTISPETNYHAIRKGIRFSIVQE